MQIDYADAEQVDSAFWDDDDTFAYSPEQRSNVLLATLRHDKERAKRRKQYERRKHKKGKR